MASISNDSITFFNYSAPESDSSANTDYLRHLICDKYVYYDEDQVIHCYAALDYTGLIGSSDLVITLETADETTTIDNTAYFSVLSNRVEWTMDISDLEDGAYKVSAYLTSSGVAQSFEFSKTSQKGHNVTYPEAGIQIYPMSQGYISNVSYPTHAAVPLPIGIATSADSFRLYENDVLIPSQVEVVSYWDKNNTPKWLHVYFDAAYTSGNPKTYLLKKEVTTNPSTNLTVTDNTPILSVTVDDASDIWTTSNAHHWQTGQPIKFKTTGSLPKVVSPIYPSTFDTKHTYYARILSSTTFTVHPTDRDAWNNTEKIDILDVGTGSHSVFTTSSWHIEAANIGSGFGIDDPDTWVASNPHGLTTGDKVVYVLPPGTTAGAVDDLLDEDLVYTVSVVNATQFILFYNGEQVASAVSNGLRDFYVVTTITVANKKIKLEVQRPYAGISTLWHDPTGTGNYGDPIADASVTGDSGPSFIDNRGITWHSKRDYFGTVEIEQSGRMQTCIRAEGWYHQNDELITPFYRNVTRMYAFASQAMVKFELATVVANNVYQNKIGDLCFNFPLTTGGVLSYGVDESTVTDNRKTVATVSTGDVITLTDSHGWEDGQPVKMATTSGTMPNPLEENTVYYANISSTTSFKLCATALDAINGTNFIDITTTGSGTLYVYDGSDDIAYLHQEKKDSCRSLGATVSAGSGSKSDGWFNIEGKNVRTTLFANNFWQKFPKEVEIGSNGIRYYAWPKHGRRVFTTAEELADDGLYNYMCFHQGKYLDLQLPTEYYEALLTNDIADDEALARYALAGYADGASIYNEFTLMFSAISTSIDEQNWAKLLQDDPIGIPDSQWCCNSQVFGNIAPPDNTNFAQVEEFVENSYSPFFNADVINSYGQFNYGDGHSYWLMRDSKSSLHRTWFNNHYFASSQGWLLFFRGQKRLMLNTVRNQTEHTASIDFQRWEEYKGYRNGQGNRIENVPQYKWHDLGQFYHCKGQTHWGAPGHSDLPIVDTYAAYWAHFVDPAGQVHAWYIDASRWSKDTYELWYRGSRTRNRFFATGASREFKGSWYGCLWAYRHFQDPALFPYLFGLIKGFEGSTGTFATGVGQAMPPFTVDVTNATDSTGNWTKTSVAWTLSAPTYDSFAVPKAQWETPELIRFTTTGTLPSPLRTDKYYWANVSSRTTNLVFKLYEYDQLDDCINNRETHITYSDQGSGTHTAYSGSNKETAPGPNWGGTWTSLWYDQYRDPEFIQWIRDNNDLYYESITNLCGSGLAYEFTGNNYELDKWLASINYQTDRKLYREFGTVYDYWGSGPGPTGDDWLAPQWPYFLYQLQRTTIILNEKSCPVEDTNIRQTSAANYGAEETLLVGHDLGTGDKEDEPIDFRILFRMDLTSLVGQTITSATLKFTHVNVLDTPTQTYNLYRLTQTGWTELGATWDKYDGSVNWSTEGGDFDPSPFATTIRGLGENLEFDATTLVQDALENRSGILNCLIDSTTTDASTVVSFASAEHSTEVYRPQLTIQVQSQAANGFNNQQVMGQYATGQSRFNNDLDDNRGATIMILHDSANGNINLKPRAYAIGNLNIQSGSLFIGLNPNTRLYDEQGEPTYVTGAPETIEIGAPIWQIALDSSAGFYYPVDPAQVRHIDYTQPLIFIQRNITWADNLSGLYKFQFNGVAYGLLQGISDQGELEACVHHNYNINENAIPATGDVVSAITYHTRGYLAPLLDNPISMEIIADYGGNPTSANNHLVINILDANGGSIADNVNLLEGRTSDTYTVTLNDPDEYHPFPWYVEILTVQFNWADINFKVLDPNTLDEVNGYDLNDAAVFGATEEAVTAIALQLAGIYTMNGGFTLSSSANVTSTDFIHVASGGIELGGEVETTLILSEYHYEASGGVELNGALGAGLFEYTYTATGGITISGVALTTSSEHPDPGADPLGQQRLECIEEGDWWCVDLPECVKSTNYREGLIPAITVCVYNKQVTRSLKEEETPTSQSS